jgi:hypothetical protein
MKKITFLSFMSDAPVAMVTLASFIGITILSIPVFAQRNTINMAERDLNSGNSFSHIQFKNINLLGHQNEIHRPSKISGYIPKYDSIYYWSLDTTDNQWEAPGYEKYIDFVYNTQNDVLSEVIQYWGGSLWVNDNMYTYTYDSHNNESSQLYQNWSGSAWNNVTLDIYTYNSNLYMVSDTTKTWNGAAWVNSNLKVYTYDGNNNLTSSTNLNWSGSAWINNSRYLAEYNVQNNCTSDSMQYWGGSSWAEQDADSYTYNSNNDQLTDTYLIWTGSAWENNSLYHYSYNSNNYRTCDTNWSWSGSAWLFNHLTAYTYNSNNDNIATASQYWNGTKWINSGFTASTYDADNLKLSNTTKNFNSLGTIVISGDSDYYYFTDALGINEVKAESEKVKVYPNPSNGRFTIALGHAVPIATGIVSSAEADQTIVEIYNVLGEKVNVETLKQSLWLSGQGDNLIDISEQPNGVYFYRVIANSGDLVGEGKLVIAK